jgi:LuxR family maltose regulon positive regulatory protein
MALAGRGDNDLNRFLALFVAALQTVRGNLGQGVLAALQSPGAVDVEAVVTTLIDEAASLADDLILILDDYHVIEQQAVDQTLADVLDRMPPQMHVVIASRADPKLPLSRLHARRQLTELREADLRFTTEEMPAFFDQVVRLGISAADVRALEKRSEGWITGLQLAAVTIQGLAFLCDDGTERVLW